KGEHLFVGHHPLHTEALVRSSAIAPIDYAILEAVSITEDGRVIPTTSIGNSSIFAEQAKAIIIEINTAKSELLEVIHDVYNTGQQGERIPIPLTKADDRIGTAGIPIDMDKVKGIVFTDQLDSP